VFSSLYLLSPCCLAPRTGGPRDPERATRVEKIASMEEFEKADFGTKATIAASAAWAPNPNNPPFFLDQPTKKGEWRREIAAKLTANAPLAVVDQYIANLSRFKGLALDAGADDRQIAATVKDLDQILNNYKIEHFFEIYEGDHVNRIGERIVTKVLPFFSKNLAFGAR
jgi:hypothetical protein